MIWYAINHFVYLKAAEECCWSSDLYSQGSMTREVGARNALITFIFIVGQHSHLNKNLATNLVIW